MERHLADLIGVFRRPRRAASESEIREQELDRAITYNDKRYNEAMNRLDVVLSDQAFEQVGIVFKAGQAIRSAEEDQLWRKALADCGVSEKDVNMIHEHKDRLILEMLIPSEQESEESKLSSESSQD
jgi:hypothetical protein